MTFGTWTDSYRMVTTAKPTRGIFQNRECFVALPKETLGACAEACAREGAPSARNMSYKCAAFAWNGEQNLCIRLPIFAADAKYTPYLKQWNGPGWQNFISKFVVKSGGHAACPLDTYVAMREGGYAVARDKNSGHLYLRCQGSSEGVQQKASCIQKECDGQPWCFVRNHCGGLFRRCRRLKQNPLTCP